MIYDGIILDVDGTIWNTTSIVAQAWNIAIEKLYPQVKRVTAEVLQGQFGKPMNVIADNLFSPLNQEQKNQLIEECCNQEQIAISENQKDITYEGVVDTIKKISQKINLYIVSNCQSGYIELVIKKLGLENYIKDFECYGNTKLGKTQNLKLLIERNNMVSPVYVGDTQGDCEACNIAGVPFIWAAYGFGKAVNFIYKIENFKELMNIIK